MLTILYKGTVTLYSSSWLRVDHAQCSTAS